MRKHQRCFRNALGLNKELVGLVWSEVRSGVFRVDHAVDDQISNVHAFRTQLLGERVRQCALGGL